MEFGNFVGPARLARPAVVTLALAIGVNSALFSVLDAALLKTLRVPQPEQLVSIILTTKSGGSMTNVPPRLFEELQRAPQAFSDVFAFWNDRAIVQWGGTVERATVQSVSGHYYSALGVRAYRGRLIVPGDEPKVAPPVAVLAHQFWVRTLGADPAAIGKTLVVSGIPRTWSVSLPLGSSALIGRSLPT